MERRSDIDVKVDGVIGVNGSSSEAEVLVVAWLWNASWRLVRLVVERFCHSQPAARYQGKQCR